MHSVEAFKWKRKWKMTWKLLFRASGIGFSWKIKTLHPFKGHKGRYIGILP